MRELSAIQFVLAKALLKAHEAGQRVKSLQLAFGEICELDQTVLQNHWA